MKVIKANRDRKREGERKRKRGREETKTERGKEKIFPNITRSQLLWLGYRLP